MNYKDNISTLSELSASEGVFTTAQAKRLGISRDALSRAAASGRAERLLKGAYRLSGTPTSEVDELAAIWKLTNPSKFTGERMRDFDGIAIGGSSAASLQGIGDFWLTPYRIYAPRRINSRIGRVRFGIRDIWKDEVIWISGIPVTRPERTLLDLCLDGEDPSLIDDALADALRKGMDVSRLKGLVARHKSDLKARAPLEHLMASIEETEDGNDGWR